MFPIVEQLNTPWCFLRIKELIEPFCTFTDFRSLDVFRRFPITNSLWIYTLKSLKCEKSLIKCDKFSLIYPHLVPCSVSPFPRSKHISEFNSHTMHAPVRVSVSFAAMYFVCGKTMACLNFLVEKWGFPLLICTSSSLVCPGQGYHCNIFGCHFVFVKD